MGEYEDCLIFLLAKAYQKAHSIFKRKISSFAITPLQHLILEILREERNISPGEIGKKGIIDNATMSGALERMNEAGLIKREENPEDRRSIHISLTSKGQDLWENLDGQRKEVNEEIIRFFSMEETKVLKRMLKIIQNLQEISN